MTTGLADGFIVLDTIYKPCQGILTRFINVRFNYEGSSSGTIGVAFLSFITIWLSDRKSVV